MRGSIRSRVGAGLAIALLAFAGCQSSAPRKVAIVEPGLSPPIEGGSGSTVVSAPVNPIRTVSWTDRHPLFTKPREYYDTSSSNNKVLRAATATFIGVPAGIVGELRQIVVGAPPAVKY